MVCYLARVLTNELPPTSMELYQYQRETFPSRSWQSEHVAFVGLKGKRKRHNHFLRSPIPFFFLATSLARFKKESQKQGI